MLREKLKVYMVMNILGDLFLLIFSFLLAYIIIWDEFRPGFLNFFFRVSLALIACWLASALFLKLYSVEQSGPKYFQAVVFHAILISIVVMLVRDFTVSRLLFVYGYILFVFFDTLARLGFKHLLSREQMLNSVKKP